MMNGHALLAERTELVTPALEQLIRHWPERHSDQAKQLAEDRHWVVTGAGASAGPAHMLVDALVKRGRVARYEPLSHFVEPSLPHGDVLCVFSQGLSPNARLALQRADAFGRTVLMTSVRPGKADLDAVVAQASNVFVLPPESEDRLLVRLIGPAVATLASLLLAETIEPLGHPLSADSIRSARQSAHLSADALASAETSALALVPFGEGARRYQGVASKLLEALGAPTPLWDVLGVTHGPLQSFFDSPITLVGLMQNKPEHLDLARRLETILAPNRGQRLLRLVSDAPAPLDWFAHDAMLDQLMLFALKARPERNLIEWPGKGADESLYDLGS